MSIETIVVWCVVGAVAGWLAGLVTKGGGFGLVGNIVVGILGAVVAGWLFPALGFALTGGIIGTILHATVGAVLVLVVLRLVRG
jgi:uncharacterized membrane protein YeaQ/YmgE (transglycosylase-associated protein family)